MQLPLQITFRGLEASAAIESRIRERAARLDKFHNHIMSCRVVVEVPHRHHHQGKLFHVRIDITIPQHEIVVNREPSEKHAYEDAFVAIRDAFDAAQRQLEHHLQKSQGKTKTHTDTEPGQVSQIPPAKDSAT